MLLFDQTDGTSSLHRFFIDLYANDHSPVLHPWFAFLFENASQLDKCAATDRGAEGEDFKMAKMIERTAEPSAREVDVAT